MMGVRYSSIIATFFMVMIYSLAMPFVYFAGFFIIFVIYWTDKYLFVTYFAAPPRHGTKLARRTYFLLEIALILHCLFGLYMVSNPSIFGFNSVDIEKSVAWAKPFALAFGNWMESWFGVSSDRFQQTHSVIYGVGIFIFLVLFIIELLFRVVSTPIELLCKIVNKRNVTPENKSTNMLRELEVEDLKH